MEVSKSLDAIATFFLYLDLDIPLNEDSDAEEVSEPTAAAEPAPVASNGNGNASDNSSANGNGARLPALRLVLSAGGASMPLERPSWTLYRAVLALNARLPAHDTHRDTTYTLTYKEIEGMETFASSSDSEDDEPCDPGESFKSLIAGISLKFVFILIIFIN